MIFCRIIEACGNSGFLTGSFSMIAKEFPDNVATMFAVLETFFGIGEKLHTDRDTLKGSSTVPEHKKGIKSKNSHS